MNGTMNDAKTSFTTEIFAGAMISVVQHFAPLRQSAFRGCGTMAACL
jgi:hypothetical protein